MPANGALSIRHTTRNFPSREGSKPGSGQLSGVALMDARSIAATTANGGILTPATDVDYDPTVPEYQYDASSYDTRVYQALAKAITTPCSSSAPTSRTGRRLHRWATTCC